MLFKIDDIDVGDDVLKTLATELKWGTNMKGTNLDN